MKKKTRILYLCFTHMMTSNDFLYLLFLFGFKFLPDGFKEGNSLHETFFCRRIAIARGSFLYSYCFQLN